MMSERLKNAVRLVLLAVIVLLGALSVPRSAQACPS
jgi:hypothetical protein